MVFTHELVGHASTITAVPGLDYRNSRFGVGDRLRAIGGDFFARKRAPTRGDSWWVSRRRPLAGGWRGLAGIYLRASAVLQ